MDSNELNRRLAKISEVMNRFYNLTQVATRNPLV